MSEVIDHLKGFIEGKPGYWPWKRWVDANRFELEVALSRGSMLRLKMVPFEEIPKVLKGLGIPFIESDYYRWPEWDEQGPTSPTRRNPTDEEVSSVLQHCQKALIELQNKARSLESFGNSPNSLFVQRVDGLARSELPSPSGEAWLVQSDSIKPVALNSPGRVADVDGIFYSYGRGSFSFTPDCKKLTSRWSLGPQFGRVSGWDMVRSAEGALELCNERVLTVW